MAYLFTRWRHCVLVWADWLMTLAKSLAVSGVGLRMAASVAIFRDGNSPVSSRARRSAQTAIRVMSCGHARISSAVFL